MKAYKSLEGYRQFVDGWVSNVKVIHSYLIMAGVKHSQRFSLSPVKAWIGSEKNGVVLCAHCNCMAGLGEACSHISAILFTFDANEHAKKSMSCTSMPCSMLPPSFTTVPFAPIAKIDFSTRDKKTLKITSNSPHGTYAGSSSPQQSAVLTPS